MLDLEHPWQAHFYTILDTGRPLDVILPEDADVVPDEALKPLDIWLGNEAEQHSRHSRRGRGPRVARNGW